MNNQANDCMRLYFSRFVEENYKIRFDATSIHENDRRQRNRNVDFLTIVTHYPSLNKQFTSEVDEYMKRYYSHKMYFRDNVFEELMKKIWCPVNFHKFNDWDPDDDV